MTDDDWPESFRIEWRDGEPVYCIDPLPETEPRLTAKDILAEYWSARHTGDAMRKPDPKPLPATPKRYSPWPLENEWAFPPEQLVALVDVLFKDVTKREWRLLGLLYAPDEWHHWWMRKAREEFTMTEPQVKAMREKLEHRLVKYLVEAHALAKEQLEGATKPTPLSRDPSVRVF